MNVMEDGKVELLQDVMSIDEALKKLGMTEQQYKSFLEHDKNSLSYQEIIKGMRQENELNGDSTEQINEIIMTSFHKTLKHVVDRGMVQHK